MSGSHLKVPTHCPILGIKLQPGSLKQQDNSPSLDRIDSTKGYVKGNVEVISFRANMVKGSSSIEELETILNYMRTRL